MKVLKPPQSGSIQGVTASHNRYGQYERNRRSPVQPVSSPRRAIARQNFGAVSRAYASIDPSLIPVWQAFALAHPIVDALGQAVKLDAHAMYVSVNAALLNAGQPTNDTPPTNLTVNPVTSVTCVALGTPAVTVSADAPAAGDFILIAASKQLPVCRTFAATFRQFAVADSTLTTQDITTDYVAQFGTPQAGDCIFFKLTPVNSSGLTGSPYVVKCVIGAGVSIPTPVVTQPTPGNFSASWTGGGIMNIHWEKSVDAGVTWTLQDLAASQASPYADTYGVPGNLVRVRLDNDVAFSPYSNVITVTS